MVSDDDDDKSKWERKGKHRNGMECNKVLSI